METVKDDMPPNPLVQAMDLKRKYESGEFKAVSPDDLVIIQSLVAIVGSVSLETTIQINA